jgi:hypothetical protein
MTKLSENSYISMGLAATMAVSLLGGGALAGQIRTNSEEINRLRASQEETQKQYTAIMIAITEIKTELKKQRK